MGTTFLNEENETYKWTRFQPFPLKTEFSAVTTYTSELLKLHNMQSCSILQGLYINYLYHMVEYARQSIQ
jgi:hypothetical protein